MRRVPNLLVAIACLLPFFRLGIGEIQPWDEALYAVRANACLKFGAWLDQTAYAIGGLYSGTHPPLGVWLIAISKSIFGDSTFAVRFPIALAAAMSILLLWLLLLKFFSRNAAALATISFAASDLFLIFSHWAQMECFILFFGLGTIYFLVQAMEKERVGIAMLSGIFLSLGLMTKFGVALFILPLMIMLPWAMHKSSGIRYSMVALLVSLVLASPWFMMMSLKHGDYWQHIAGSLVTLSAGRYSPSKLAWWYYLNQLIVAMPVMVVALMRRKWNRIGIASIVWLCAVLAVLQMVGTKMPHFATLLLLPAAFVIAEGFNALEFQKGNTSNRIVIVMMILGICWSASEQIRLLLTRRLAFRDLIFSVPALIIIAIALVISFIVWVRTKEFERMAIVLSILLIGIAFSHLISEKEPVFENGAENVAHLAMSLPQKTSIVVIHSDWPNEKYAPQLAYYTEGWTLGWIPGKQSKTYTWDSVAAVNYIPDTLLDIAVVARFEDRFYRPPQNEAQLWNQLMSILRTRFAHEQEFRSYSLFY